MRNEESSLITEVFFLQKFLFGVGRAMWSVSEGFIPVRVRYINYSVG